MDAQCLTGEEGSFWKLTVIACCVDIGREELTTSTVRWHHLATSRLLVAQNDCMICALLRNTGEAAHLFIRLITSPWYTLIQMSTEPTLPTSPFSIISGWNLRWLFNFVLVNLLWAHVGHTGRYPVIAGPLFPKKKYRGEAVKFDNYGSPISFENTQATTTVDKKSF